MTSRLTRGMVEEAKTLLTLIGIPWIQAPSEGEAQASHLSREGQTWATGSKDYDSLLFGAPRLVRFLAVASTEFLPSRGRSRAVPPELLDLDENLRALGLTREELIDAAILIGTDFKPGVRGSTIFRGHEKPLNKVHPFLPNQRPGAGCVRPEGGENLAESGTPVAPPARAGGGRSRLLIVAVVILVIALIAVSAYALIPKASAKLQVELWYNNSNHYGSTEVAVALALQNSIASCGKGPVTLKSDVWTAYKTRWTQQQMPMFLLGWYPDYFDTDDYISPFLAISGAKSEGSFYNNSQVDQWVRDEASTSDPAIRADRFAKIQAALVEDVPYIPLWSGAAQVAYVNGVQNVELHPVSYKWFIVNKPGATQLNASTSDHIIDLDPASAYDFMSIEVINQVFDTLLVYDAKNTTLLPGLATRVPTVANGDVSADGKSYTFHLRQGGTFSDGTQFNSSVMKRSIDRPMRLDLAGRAAFLLYDVGALPSDHLAGDSATGEIDTPDPYNITFHLFSHVTVFIQRM